MQSPSIVVQVSRLLEILGCECEISRVEFGSVATVLACLQWSNLAKQLQGNVQGTFVTTTRWQTCSQYVEMSVSPSSMMRHVCSRAGLLNTALLSKNSMGKKPSWPKPHTPPLLTDSTHPASALENLNKRSLPPTMGKRAHSGPRLQTILRQFPCPLTTINPGRSPSMPPQS